MDFIETELADAGVFEDLTWETFISNSMIRRNVERWVENLVNAAIDTAKIILASHHQRIPQTYRETILRLSSLVDFDASIVGTLAGFTKLRNLLAHEYLDVTWPHIREFTREAPEVYRKLLDTVKKFIE